MTTRRPPSYFYTFAFMRIFAIKRIDVMDYPQYDNVRSLRAMELSSTLPDLSIASQEALRVVVAVDGETVFDGPTGMAERGSLLPKARYWRFI